jgi:hypothetical protein
MVWDIEYETQQRDILPRQRRVVHSLLEAGAFLPLPLCKKVNSSLRIEAGRGYSAKIEGSWCVEIKGNLQPKYSHTSASWAQLAWGLEGMQPGYIARNLVDFKYPYELPHMIIMRICCDKRNYELRRYAVVLIERESIFLGQRPRRRAIYEISLKPRRHLHTVTALEAPTRKSVGARNSTVPFAVMVTVAVAVAIIVLVPVLLLVVMLKL